MLYLSTLSAIIGFVLILLPLALTLLIGRFILRGLA